MILRGKEPCVWDGGISDPEITSTPLMFGPLRRLASWFIFLHFNSNVGVGRLTIFAMCLQQLGTVLSFTFAEVVRGQDFLRSMRRMLSWLVRHQVYGYTLVQTFYLQLIVASVFVLVIAALFLVK